MQKMFSTHDIFGGQMIKKLFVVSLMFALFAVSVQAACLVPTVFDGILKVNVDKDGYVDYDAIRVNKGGDLYEFISFLETADLKKCTELDRKAFWINAYNAHMIRLVLARPQMKSISEDFKIFGEKFKVANKNLSLNEIEHQILRSSTKKGGPIADVSIKELDPRIHFALVFGAAGSPNLHPRAYTGQNVEATLQANAVNFSNNPKHLRIEDITLFTSSLLRWYAEDFSNVGGAGVYLASLIDPEVRLDAPAVIEKLKTDYPDMTQFRFDWTVNSIKNKPAPAVTAPQ